MNAKTCEIGCMRTGTCGGGRQFGGPGRPAVKEGRKAQKQAEFASCRVP